MTRRQSRSFKQTWQEELVAWHILLKIEGSTRANTTSRSPNQNSSCLVSKLPFAAMSSMRSGMEVQVGHAQNFSKGTHCIGLILHLWLKRRNLKRSVTACDCHVVH